jgi:hypothetical protein
MILVTTLGVVACEGETTKETSSPYSRFAAEYSRALCDALAPCCSLVEFSVESCRAWLGLGFVAEAKSARPENYVFHQDRADQCLADISARGLCSGGEPESCRTVTEGKLPGGSECRGSAECLSTDRTPGGCFAGLDDVERCVYPGRAAGRGEACVGDCDDIYGCSSDMPGMDSFCYPDTGLWCNGGTCQDFDAIGAPCTFDTCAVGAMCSGSVCVAQGAAGAACASSEECTDANYCSNGICAARLPAGSACTATDSCLNGSCIEGSCFDFILETLCVFGTF